jgi:hypothetical protein
MRPLAPPTDRLGGPAHTAFMSDQAVVWKFAFGVLVLVFCAVAFVTRKDTEPSSAAPAPLHVPVPLPVPMPAASAPPAALDPAPVDVPEVQEAPQRIRISLQQPLVARKHHAVRHGLRKVVHRRHRRLSPYVAGRQHYPFDPRERWLSPAG